jgi:hypothetical protein
MRRLLQPILKLFFNPNPLIQALHIQSRLNTMYAEREAKREAARHELDQLHFEVMHNLVVETTRLGIEVKNLKMRVESLTSRLEFNERRARALESVVVYKPALEDRREPPPMREERAAESAPPVREPSRPLPPTVSAPPTPTPTEGPGQRSRRRRRRRGRRGTGSAAAIMNPTESGPSAGALSASHGPREPGASEEPGGSDQTEFSASESEPFDGPDTDDSESPDNEQ